jgi:hypothetical protein
MKKLALLFTAICTVAFAAGALAAGTNPVSPPTSTAFGKSLDDWMGTYFRQLYTMPAVVGDKNVTFLPISCPVDTATCACTDRSPTHWACTFEVTIAPGNALALPFISWIGWNTLDDFLPSECWGATCPASSNIYNITSIFADATLDGKVIGEPSASYYVGPTPFEPPIACPQDWDPANMCVLYQAIGVVIKPLTPGAHQLVLNSGMMGTDPPGVDWMLSYDNVWNIRVVPPGRK